MSAHGHGIAEETPLPAVERAREALLMGMRLNGGIDPAHFARRTGISLEALISTAARERLQAHGLIDAHPGRLKATPAGMLVPFGMTNLLVAGSSVKMQPDTSTLAVLWL